MTDDLSTLSLFRNLKPHGVNGFGFSVECLGNLLFSEDEVKIWNAKVPLSPIPMVYLAKPAHIPLPPHALKELPDTCCVVSFQGVCQGVWYDGPLIHWHFQECLTWVPEGYPVHLRLANIQHGTERKGTNLAPEINFSRAIVGSLTTAIRTQISPLGRKRFVVQSFDLEEFVIWVLLRKALPNLSVYPIKPDQEFKKWPSVAKRVCQNIGWSMYERALDLDGEDLDLGFIHPAIRAYSRDLARELCMQSAVIPQGLWA